VPCTLLLMVAGCIASPGNDEEYQIINRNGGDVTLVHLPEIGIKGNTHFPMSDLNTLEVANHLSEFLARKSVD
jgi:hypothetical protein